MTRQGRTARPARTNATSASPTGTDAVHLLDTPVRNSPAEVRGASVACAEHALLLGTDRRTAAGTTRGLLAALGLPTTDRKDHP